MLNLNKIKSAFCVGVLCFFSLFFVQCSWLPFLSPPPEEPLTELLREELRIRIPIGSQTIYVNGEEITISFPPAYINNNGGAMIPLRFISDIMEAEIDWIPETKEIKILQEEKTILLQVQRPYAKVNNTIIELVHPVEIKEERSFVSLRFVAQHFGFLTDWIPESKTIELIKNY